MNLTVVVCLICLVSHIGSKPIVHTVGLFDTALF